MAGLKKLACMAEKKNDEQQLIESELFGHRRILYRRYWRAQGLARSMSGIGLGILGRTGEMELAIQVNLLRVIETRKISAVGDIAIREFKGKLIAVTKRDLPLENSSRPVPRGSLLPVVRGSDSDSIARRSDSGFAGCVPEVAAVDDDSEGG